MPELTICISEKDTRTSPRGHCEWIEHRLDELANLGSIPVTSKCFFSTWVYGGRKVMDLVIIKFHEMASPRKKESGCLWFIAKKSV